MLMTLALSTVLFASGAPAQVPTEKPAAKETAPVAVGTLPPRIVELTAEKDGKVLIAVMRQQMINAPAGAPGGNPGGGGFRGVMMRQMKVELSDVKDLKITTAAGKEVSKEDAIKALAKGGRVVVSADGKGVAPAFLKLFKDDVLVMVSPEFVGGANAGIMIQGGPIGVIPAGPRAVPLPAPVPPQKID